MSVTLSGVIARYIERKIANEEWTGKTLVNYRSTLVCFIRRVKEIHGCDPETQEVDTQIILRAIEKQWPDKDTKTTYGTMAQRIKAFFVWATKRGYEFGDIDSFLAKNFTLPQVERTFATRDEAENAIALLRKEDNHRDAALIGFLMETPRRPGEACQIRVKDLDFKRTAIHPHGCYWFRENKSKKGAQQLILTEANRELLERWLKEYEEEMGMPPQGEWFLFPAREVAGPSHVPGRKRMRLIPERAISAHSRLISDIWKKAGVYEVGKAGHACRRGVMTEMFDGLEEMGHPDPIQAVMGQSKHTSRVAAEGYINRRSSQLRSDRAFLELEARRRHPSTQTPVPEPEEISSNVVSFSELRARRRLG